MSTKYDSAMVIVIVLIFIRTLLRYSNLYGIDSSTSLVASAFVFFALVSQYNYKKNNCLYLFPRFNNIYKQKLNNHLTMYNNSTYLPSSVFTIFTYLQ